MSRRDITEQRKSDLEKLLQNYFEFSVPVVSCHFAMRWSYRFKSKSAAEIFEVMKRSSVVFKDDKFELYDPHTHIRIAYQFQDDRVVLCTIFELKTKNRSNWISRIENRLRQESGLLIGA